MEVSLYAYVRKHLTQICTELCGLQQFTYYGGITSVLLTLQSFSESSDSKISVKCFLIRKHGARLTGVCVYDIGAFSQRFFPCHLCPGWSFVVD